MLRSSSSSSSISSLLQILIMVSDVILSPSLKCSSAKVNEPWSTSTNVFEFHFRSTLSQVSLLNIPIYPRLLLIFSYLFFILFQIFYGQRQRFFDSQIDQSEGPKRVTFTALLSSYKNFTPAKDPTAQVIWTRKVSLNFFIDQLLWFLSRKLRLFCVTHKRKIGYLRDG